MKKITVLVSLYKASRFLPAKLDNLIKQTYFNKCNIVLLNCQNLENESLIYAKYTKKYKNIISKNYTEYIKLYPSWNDGIKMTKSEYIMNSNVDDMLHPEYIETCCKHLDNNPQIGYVTTQVSTTYTPCQVRPDWKPDSKMCIRYPKGTVGPCPVWRRSLHDDYGYFGDFLSIGDAVMWEIWHSNKIKFDVINKKMVLYYYSQSSLERRTNKNGKRYNEIDRKSKEYKQHKIRRSQMDMRNGDQGQ